MLQGNSDFHDWIITNSKMRMPMRLELFYANLNNNNMKRRLFYIYKWKVGRSDATRSGYAQWLKKLVDWMVTKTGVTLPDQAATKIIEYLMEEPLPEDIPADVTETLTAEKDPKDSVQVNPKKSVTAADQAEVKATDKLNPVKNEVKVTANEAITQTDLDKE